MKATAICAAAVAIGALAIAGNMPRAELLARLKAPAITKVNGLVRVFADCPEDMRREYQMPAASFAANTCRSLYAHFKIAPPRFAEPGIIVHVGDERTNDTSVVSAAATRRDGTRFTRIRLNAPAYSDLEKFRLAVVRAFMFAVKGEEIDDKAAFAVLIEADPQARTEMHYAEIDRWLHGEKTHGDDEEMLKLCRSVLDPGDARPSDVLRFASRLFLYPASFDKPFAGGRDSCTFAQAIELAKEDPRVRLAALEKAPQMVLFGGGRGEELCAAAESYSRFLFAIARGKDDAGALREMLADAELKLNIALEKARENHPGKK